MEVEKGSWVPSRSFHVDVLKLSLLSSVFEETYSIDLPLGMARDALFLSNMWLFEGRCVLTGRRKVSRTLCCHRAIREGAFGAGPQGILLLIHLLAIFAQFQPV